MASTSWPSGLPNIRLRSLLKSAACRRSRSSPRRGMFADGPSTFVSGHGIDAFSAGVQTFRAYHCLLAISGNIDRPGGNMRARTPKGFKNYLDLLHDPAFRLDAETERKTIGTDRYPLWAGPKGWQMACHNSSVIEAMLTDKPYPVRALYASGVNILVTYPDTRRTMEALRRLDFVAVAAHAMTPTAEFADLVLPKTATLEEEEVSFMPSGPTVLFTRAVVAAAGRGPHRDRHRPAAAGEDGRAAGDHQAAGAVVDAARLQHLPAGRQRHPHRGAGAHRLRAGERRARHARGPALQDADRQDRAVLEDAGGAGARSAACLRADQPRRAAAGHAGRLSADSCHRRPGEELSPLPLPRSALGAQGLARPASHRAPATRHAPWA